MFCLEFSNVPGEQSVFSSYWINHFHRPWQGDQSDRDHYLIPNSLGYVHDSFKGPLPEGVHGTSSKLGAFADFFLINDIGSFYLAVNVRGLESEISYDITDDGTYEVFEIGNRLAVKLLDLTQGPTEWEEIGQLELDNKRNGFWHSTVTEKKALEAYSMLGLFDENSKSTLTFKEPSVLKESPPPVLWAHLPRTPTEDIAQRVPLPFS